MILHIGKSIDKQQLEVFLGKYRAIFYELPAHYVVITPSAVKSVEGIPEKDILFSTVCDSDIQLASRQYRKEKRTIRVGDLVFGQAGQTVMMAGPCGVESEAQIEQSSALLRELGLKVLRAGAFKPRTSPYSYQGMGLEGLKLLDKMRQKYGFSIITEVRDASQVDAVIEYADIIQIGAKSMYDHGILRKCAKTNKPVMLKRGFGATLQEFVQMAEFILSGGNENVMLCERGIRTFETKTRFTLDLCGVAYLKEHVNLPIILDPSHAMGYAYGVADLTRACLAMNVDGLLIEVHPNPREARSDASQQLDHDEFRALYHNLVDLSKALKINLL